MCIRDCEDLKAMEFGTRCLEELKSTESWAISRSIPSDGFACHCCNLALSLDILALCFATIVPSSRDREVKVDVDEPQLDRARLNARWLTHGTTLILPC